MTRAAPLPRWWILVAGLLVATVQLAVPGSIIAGRIALLSAGHEITLKTVPVDPRDLFRGDYVILNFAISRVELADVPHPDTIDELDEIFVIISPQDDDWAVSSLSEAMPDTMPPGAQVLRADVDYLSGEGANRTARLRYGVESYFVPEGTGRDLEKLVRDKALSVIVAVGPGGRAAIKGLVIDGERIYDEPLL
ncbi:MAG: GDYXXLXY domain-containing protein [Rhodobiaceae bacterium]|nr:GDYXXLXY domain-containing protein [Rhodobiaceae bacterium]MCC0041492.1 GDYXXLXY domain-containing protein [Rhodobiaceae bacterium]